MNTTLQALEYDRYFHIYNRGINSCDLFLSDRNYEYFLIKYKQYISPVAETFAWCLMKNHFHLLVKILPEDEIKFIKQKNGDTRVFPELKKYNPTRQFSHFFNSYAKSFNIENQRTGGLFESPFKRKLIEDETYLKQLIYYIHQNPVKSGIVKYAGDYRWSSFNSIISNLPSDIQKDKVLNWFGSVSEFIEFHKRDLDTGDNEIFD